MVVDLNLLRVFDALLEERNVTRAGARLGLTQSAVSHALNRLRHQLNDELFVRGSSGMRPTPRALEMGPYVHAALGQLQSAVAPHDFDPLTSERRFTLVTGAYGCAVFVPALVSRLSEVAPKVRLVVAEHTANVADRMDAREVDFLIGSVAGAPDRFERDTLLVEELAWVVSATAPLARTARVDLAALASTPHIVIARPPSETGREAGGRDLATRGSRQDAGAFEAALAAHGLRRRVGVTVPDSYSALAVASRSEMAALVPRRLALMSAQGGRLKLIEPPYASPPVEVRLSFLKERLGEPSFAWMRQMILATAQSV